MKSIPINLIAAIFVALCVAVPVSSQTNLGLFSSATSADGRVYRTNTATGETWLISGDRMQKVQEPSTPPLEVGQKYYIENNRSIIYLGDGKFSEPVVDYSQLWN